LQIWRSLLRAEVRVAARRVSSQELALLFAVQMVAVSQVFFEIPDGVDHAVDGTDEFIAGRRDPEREITDARQFAQECFRIEHSGVGHLLGAYVFWRHLWSVEWTGGRMGAVKNIPYIAYRFYMTYIV
jgi:hypothetical protein